MLIKTYNVILYNPNKKDFEYYDIFPYFLAEYNKLEVKPKTFTEFKIFITEISMYKFWSRCEYEIILKDWPNFQVSKKIDVFYQISMNIDSITKLFKEYAESN